MPTKPNRAGKPQNYVPAGNGDASGEYGNEKGGNKHFTNFKKQDSAFDEANKQRVGGKLSSQPKNVPQEKPVLKAPSTYKEWAESIITEERRGNPPEPVKMRLKDTPIQKVDDKNIEEVRKEHENDKDFDPTIVDKAVELIRKYEKSVDETAGDLEEIADSLGGVMVGMEFRLKRLTSTARKLNSYIIEEREKGNEITVDDAVGKMRDTARFTMCFDENNFAGGVEKAFEEMEKRGYKLVRAKNTFTPGSSYKGLNCNFIDKQGNIFELQFHIPATMKIKEGIEVDVKNKSAISNRTNVTAHDIYETTRVIEDKMRNGTATPEEKQLYNELMAESKRRWDAIPNYEFPFLK